MCEVNSNNELYVDIEDIDAFMIFAFEEPCNETEVAIISSIKGEIKLTDLYKAAIEYPDKRLEFILTIKTICDKRYHYEELVPKLQHHWCSEETKSH